MQKNLSGMFASYEEKMLWKQFYLVYVCIRLLQKRIYSANLPWYCVIVSNWASDFVSGVDGWIGTSQSWIYSVVYHYIMWSMLGLCLSNFFISLPSAWFFFVCILMERNGGVGRTLYLYKFVSTRHCCDMNISVKELLETNPCADTWLLSSDLIKTITSLCFIQN